MEVSGGKVCGYMMLTSWCVKLIVLAYNDRVLAFLRQPNMTEMIKERSRSLWSNTQLKNKITLIRSEGIQGLERFANDVDLITLLRYGNLAWWRSGQGSREVAGLR